MEVEEENDSHLINKEDGEKDVAIKEKKATIENLECENKDFNDSNDINDISNNKRKPLIRLPLAKVKNIIKLDDDIKLVQKDAYLVIGKLTELFIEELARDAFSICKANKRKTISMEDINSALKLNDKMGFIDFDSIFYVEDLEKKKKKKTEKDAEEKVGVGDEKTER